MANAMPEYGGTVLRPGASGPDIALVQRWLGGLNVDGRYGTSTETAVRRFQREQGLKIDGHVPELTTDGRYGASTREAVLAWQVVHDLKPDGMLGRATWNSLYGVTTRKA